MFRFWLSGPLLGTLGLQKGNKNHKNMPKITTDIKNRKKTRKSEEPGWPRSSKSRFSCERGAYFHKAPEALQSHQKPSPKALKRCQNRAQRDCRGSHRRPKALRAAPRALRRPRTGAIGYPGAPKSCPKGGVPPWGKDLFPLVPWGPYPIYM